MQAGTMHMEALGASRAYRQPGHLVLDVRSRAEYQKGHVPGSLNVPVDEIARAPARFARRFARYRRVYVHCSSGERAAHARNVLAWAGLKNLVHISDSGMPDWVARHYPVRRSISLTRDVLTGMLAGLAGNLAVGPVDRLLANFVSERQKWREAAVREGSPHKVGGRKLGERVLGRRLSRDEAHTAQAAFTIAYGMLWGAIYALVRRRVPQATTLFGVPYGVAFFFACDGFLAPLARMTPGVQRIPWQFNAKEMMNHITWTIAAEAVHRGAERRLAPSGERR